MNERLLGTLLITFLCVGDVLWHSVNSQLRLATAGTSPP